MLIFEQNPDQDQLAQAQARGAVIVLRFLTDDPSPTPQMLKEFLASKGFDPCGQIQNLAVFASPTTETEEEFQARVKALFEQFNGRPNVEDAISTMMELSPEQEQPEEWLTTYVARRINAWQFEHGLLHPNGVSAAIAGISLRMVNRPPIDEIDPEDLCVEVTKVFFGTLSFSGAIGGPAAECLNRLIFRLLNEELSLALSANERYDEGEQFHCCCRDEHGFSRW